MDSPLGEWEYKPKVGMVFESVNESYDFYNEYGRQIGFSIRRDHTNKNQKTGEVTSAKFVCSKEGYREKDKRDNLTKEARAKTRTGCGAFMHIKLVREKILFFLDRFEEVHNHEFIRKYCTHLMPSQRNISVPQAIDVDLAADSGLPIGSAYELMGRQVGAREAIGFTKVDQNNYLRTKRQKQLQFGEAGCIFEYFQSQLLDNPSFFHAVQLDNQEMITNVFWADARMIIDYGHFGDVVTFDTTYNKNNANRPFAAFVGLNHHRETVIFGAALMYDETADSFVWLFQKFLVAMSQKNPRTIVTDQDAGIAKGLALVMPGTHHHLCTWHIMQNAMKHLGHVRKGSVGIKSILFEFVNQHEDEDEFEMCWESMLIECGVRDNKWLSVLYGLRTKWAKTFVKHHWCAGIRSTQLSESLNATLKKYLKSDHTIPDFFKNFDRMVTDNRYKELLAEYNLASKLPKINNPNTMLVQVSERYTRIIFEQFQQQFEKMVEIYHKETIEQDGEFIYMMVSLEGHSQERRVRKRQDGYLMCNCGKFEMEGFLCSHVIKVIRELHHKTELPEEYIVKRWTRGARDEAVLDFIGREVQADPSLQQRQRFRDMCHLFTRVSSFASEGDEFYNLSIVHGQHLLKLLEDMRREKRVLYNDENLSKVGNRHQIRVTYEQSGHKITVTGLKKRDTSRGRKKRYKSSQEIHSQNKKKSLKQPVESYVMNKGAEIQSKYAFHICQQRSPPPSPRFQRSDDYRFIQFLNQGNGDRVTTNAETMTHDLSQPTTELNISSQTSYCKVNETNNHGNEKDEANPCDDWNRERNPEVQFGRYSQRGYQTQPPTSWASSGPQIQQPGYGFVQPGAYPGPSSQYGMSQPPYNGYPQQNQQTAQGGGYDYYSQAQPQQQASGGSSASADNTSYGGYNAPVVQSGYGSRLRWANKDTVL